MLSDNPATPSPSLERRPPSRPGPVAALQTQVPVPDNGYTSPRQQLERRSPASGSPFQPQHGLNPPRPSLSPLSEYHSGYSNEDLGLPGSSSSSPYNIATHRRQQSFPNLLPLAFRSRTPSPTRKTQHSRSPSEQMPYTGDGRSNGRTAADSPQRGGGGLISWLSGSAAAAHALGLPAPNSTPTKDGTTPDTTPARLRQSAGPGGPSDPVTPKSTTMTTASRFISSLSSRFNNNGNNPTTPTTTAANDDLTDEFCTLNIEAALFPHHHHPSLPSSPSSPSSPPFSPQNRDAFSPSAFKNLHMNAAGLLARMQAAYRAQSAALRELRAERAAERDELEEARTRAEHLKMQLKGMAGRVLELEGERNERKAAAARGVGEDGEGEGKVGRRRRRVPSEEGASMVSEDLGVDEDRRRRRGSKAERKKHRGSWKSAGGASGRGGEEEGEEEEETEEEDDYGTESAESESVFSRCRSPALPPLAGTVSDVGGGGTSVMGVMDGGPGTPLAKVPVNVSASATPKQNQISAFQKILKGISGGGDSADGSGADGCANCRGQDASVAWDTVGLLRDENRHLKRRVGELEVAVEGALDLVNGIGL